MSPPPTSPSDEDFRALIHRCLAGDQGAILALVERFKNQVFGLCYRMLGNRHDAEDMTQESLVRVLRNLDRWDSTRDFMPWVLAITGNRCRTLLARRKRRPEPTDLVDHLADRGPDLQAAQTLAEEVDRAVADLRIEYRQAFVLFHEQELSYAQIGEALGCPLGTVKTWVHRARREIVDQLRRRGVVREKRHAVRKV